MVRRLRYSVSDEQWALIEDAAKALHLDPKTVLQLTTSLGLRFLDMSLIHPLGGGIGKAIDDRLDQGTAAVLADFTSAFGQHAGAEGSAGNSEALPASKRVVQRKKVSAKRK